MKTKPQVNYFNAFGSTCTLLHTDASSRSKFAEKAFEYYFVVYATNKTAYHVYYKRVGVINESFNVDWQELEDVHTKPD